VTTFVQTIEEYKEIVTLVENEDESSMNPQELSIWQLLQQGYANSERCKDTATLVERPAPQNFKRWDLNTPTSSDRVYSANEFFN
jgi:hypothetical protein